MSALCVINGIVHWIAFLMIFIIILNWIGVPKSRHDPLLFKAGFRISIVYIITLLINFFISRNIFPDSEFESSIVVDLIFIGIFGGICLYGLEEIKKRKSV